MRGRPLSVDLLRVRLTFLPFTHAWFPSADAVPASSRFSCDYWVDTCEDLETAYTCDCDGCACPTPTPTAPTSAPTGESRLTLVPPSLALEVTKPGWVQGTFYLVNLNSQSQNWTLSVNYTTLPNTTQWYPSRSSSTIEPGENYALVGSINSAGLSPGAVYETSLIIDSEKLGVAARQFLTFTLRVNARMDANYSYVHITGSPTLGELFEKLHIFPFDSDGTEITVATSEDLTVQLSHGTTESLCKMVWSTNNDGIHCYSALCEVPLVTAAGIWRADVKLNGKLMHSSPIRMNCPASKYEDARGDCQPCMNGVGQFHRHTRMLCRDHSLTPMTCSGFCPTPDCDAKGSKVGALQLDRGFWRHSETSDEIIQCPYWAGCQGGNLTRAAAYCDVGFHGPLVSDFSMPLAISCTGIIYSTYLRAASFQKMSRKVKTHVKVHTSPHFVEVHVSKRNRIKLHNNIKMVTF